MTLNEQLIRLSSYKINFNIYEDIIIISLVYPKTWTVLQTKSNEVQTTSENGRYFYWIPLETNVEKVFELIDETIEYNKDIEAKAELFKQKINEMKQLFLEEDFQTLKTMEFKLKKKKSPKKKAESENTEEENTESVVANQDNQTVKEETAVSLEETGSKVKEATEIDKMIEKAVMEKENKQN